IEVIHSHPSCLLDQREVGLAQAALYQQSSAAAKALPSALLREVLGALLDLGADVRDAPMVLQAIEESRLAQHPTEKTAEIVFTRLRSDQVEIHMNPAYLRALIHMEVPSDGLSFFADTDGNTSSEVREASMLFCEMERLCTNMGILLPDLVLISS